MADYTGKKCLVCENEFESGDDIVVCPECGTPYHRACYLEKGECINYELHEKKGSWQEEQRAAQQERIASGEITKCPRCGGENPGNALFCNFCGLPMGVNQGAQQSFNDQQSDTRETFGGQQYGGMGTGMDPMLGGMMTQRFTPESDIDGNTLGEYANYVRTNRGYFMANFIRFGKFAKKTSFSIMAFVFPEYYFFYRKMFKVGILTLLAMILLSVPSLLFSFNAGSGYLAEYEKLLGMTAPAVLINDLNLDVKWFVSIANLCTAGTWAVHIVCGLFANFWYYKKAKKDIERIKSFEGHSDEIAEKGGTSIGMLILGFALYMAVSFGVLLAFHYRADIMAMLG